MRRRAELREEFNSLKPEQREALFKYREQARIERFRVGEELRAGKLDRQQARARLQKWREDHKPPVELKRPGRPNGE
jgi:hypothetical protein